MAGEMKTIGILGGMSDQATAEYYRLINAAVNQRLGGWNTAEILINSVNFAKIERCVRTHDWPTAGDYLKSKAHALERGGADLIICVSNTMHRVAHVFTEGLSIPFIHIADPTGEALRNVGIRRAALIGTRPVMSASFLKRHFTDRFGVEIIVPSREDQQEVDRIIFNELVRGTLWPRSRRTYLSIIAGLRKRGAQGVILGSTEIFLLLSQEDLPDFPMFNTTSLHVEAAVRMALEDASDGPPRQ